MTGNWVGSTTQAIAAAMSGVLFIAILIRTGSIIPAMIVHWLWDFGIFAMSSRHGANAEAAAQAELGIMTIVGPLLFVLPNFLYGLWLFRGVWGKSSEELLD